MNRRDFMKSIAGGAASVGAVLGVRRLPAALPEPEVAPDLVVADNDTGEVETIILSDGRVIAIPDNGEAAAARGARMERFAELYKNGGTTVGFEHGEFPERKRPERLNFLDNNPAWRKTST